MEGSQSSDDVDIEFSSDEEGNFRIDDDDEDKEGEPSARHTILNTIADYKNSFKLGFNNDRASHRLDQLQNTGLDYSMLGNNSQSPEFLSENNKTQHK